MNVFSSISIFVNNSFYYPEPFILFIIFFCLFLLILFFRFFNYVTVLVKEVKNIILNCGTILAKHEIETLLWLVFVILISRYFISYGSVSSGFKTPEKTIALHVLGVDFQTGIIFPTMDMIHGKFFYNEISNYGPAIPLTLAPTIKYMVRTGICQYGTSISCLSVLYPWLGIITGIIFLSLICLVKRTHHLREGTLVLLGIIFLGISGTFALERGNPDLLFSGILSIYIAIILSGIKIHRFASFILGLILGYIISAKIFLSIFIVPFMFLLPNPVTFGISIVGTWVVLSYLPGLYGVAGGPIVIIKNTLIWSKAATNNFLIPYNLSNNISLLATASLFSLCRQINSCGKENLLEIVYYNSILGLLGFIVFLLPIVELVSRILRIIKKKSFQMVHILLNVQASTFGIVLLCFGVAAINLISGSAYTYRILYSLPPMILLFSFTAGNSKAKAYLMLSIVCFSMKNIWIGQMVNPLKFSPFDPRVQNIFVVLHYYYLIKSGLEIFAKDYFIQANKNKVL